MSGGTKDGTHQPLATSIAAAIGGGWTAFPRLWRRRPSNEAIRLAWEMRRLVVPESRAVERLALF